MRRALALELSNSGPSVRLHDGAPLGFFAYVDNVGVIGKSKDLVDGALSRATSALSSVGLLCKTEDAGCRKAKTLGVEFNDDLQCCRHSDKRYWRLRRALRWFLRPRKFTGRQLEVLLGHATFFSMLSRAFLPVMLSVHKFVRCTYRESQALWGCCREELTAVLGLMPS